jgi:putative endonuclease
MAGWFLYLIRVGNGSLYTGITRDVDRRFEEHASGARSGAKFFRGKGPLELVFRYQVGTRSLALKAEAAIKKLPKLEKENLVKGDLKIETILAGLAASRKASPAEETGD